MKEVTDLTPDEAADELARLTSDLAEHDRRYFQDDAPQRRHRGAFSRLGPIGLAVQARRRRALGGLLARYPWRSNALIG
jgi:hypothetical protein